ncbi:MAG: ABC transporter permease [Lentisphaerota bacterium]
MSSFWPLWKREIGAYFLSPIAYVVTVFFLVVMGFSFWMLASILAQGTEGVAVMNELFGSIFFWMAMMVVIPVITMRLFAEEKRSGTMETLMTAPVTDTAVVLAKFFGAWSFFVVMWLPTLGYAFILKRYSALSAPVDFGPMASGYLGAFLLGGFYLSIGLFCTALTRNQIVAAISCFALICMAFFAGFTPYLARTETLQDFGSYISSVEQMLDFSRGAVDTRPIVLYLSGTALMLFATVKVVESRKWK